MASPVSLSCLQLFLCFQCWLSLKSSLTVATDKSFSFNDTFPTDEYGDYNGADIIKWIRAHPEGIVHPSVRIGRQRPGDPNSINGLFANSSPETKPIEEGDIIARIPWDHMIHPGKSYAPNKFFNCRAIRNLADELKLGETSTRAPYVRYLLSQPRGSMPGEWSKAGQDFLSFMLGDGELPPYDDMWRDEFEDTWVDHCNGNPDDPIERAAFYLSSSRDEDSLMVPIYDMANHSNEPDKLNTLSFKPSRAGDSFRFVASRKIMPGEEIYNCYNRCNACSDVPRALCDTFSFYRTPDLFVHFGFVEDFPQSWEFDAEDEEEEDSEFAFCLEKDSETNELVVFWDHDKYPDPSDIKYLKRQMKRLLKIGDQKEELKQQWVAKDQNEAGTSDSDTTGDESDGQKGKMSLYEWDSAWRYYDGLTTAMGAAISSMKRKVPSGEL